MKKFKLSIIAILLTTAAMAQFDVVFNVDMSYLDGFDPAVHSVYLAGSLNDWPEPGSAPEAMLTRVGTTLIYTITITLDTEQEIIYKYFSNALGFGWDGGEWLGEPNRTVFVNNFTTIDGKWGNKPVFVNFSVDVSTIFDTVPDTTGIYMAGTINYACIWNQPGIDPSLKMNPSADDPLIYELSLLLPTDEYQYKYFYVNNSNPSWEFGEWSGGPNREITVDSLYTEFFDIWGLITGVSSSPQTKAMAIYPNPCKSSLNITIVNNNTNIEKIVIYDISGEIVRIIDDFNTEISSINTRTLENGVYLLVVHTPQGIQTSKFVKE